MSEAEAENLHAVVPESQRGGFDRRMLEALVCPFTQTTLRYDAERQELVSKAAGLAYPIRGGIPILLADEARRLK
ncbi:hypothetical protein SAMN05877809_10953 [Rhodobacter sp. JA431]|nr:hypothetical protein SAMN05877809_10953 [Rhodobacter sp. JA431]